MSNISTFGTYTVARLGIYASHKAIDIVGNNITNINTDGYTRQDIDQFSMNMGAADRYQSLLDTRIGSGVFVSGVHQMRDQFMDIRYRDEQANVGAMEGYMEGYSDIERILDEVGRGEDEEGVLEARFNEMIQMMERLNTQGAGRDEFDSLFRSSAVTVVDTIHAYAAELKNETEILDLKFRQDVDSINSILVRIRDLNSSIRKAQIYGGNALEQQDQRNLLIDELSSCMRIDVTMEKESLGEKKYVDRMVIKTADEPQRTLVYGRFAAQLTIRSYETGETDSDGNPIRVEDSDYSLDLGPLKDVNGGVKTIKETDDDMPLLPKQNKDGSEAYEYSLRLDEDGLIYHDDQGNSTLLMTAKFAKPVTEDAGESEYSNLDLADPASAEKAQAVREFLEDPASHEELAELFPASVTGDDGLTYNYTYAAEEENGIFRVTRTLVSTTEEVISGNGLTDPELKGTDPGNIEFANKLLPWLVRRFPDSFPDAGLDEDSYKVTYDYEIRTDPDSPVDEDGNHTSPLLDDEGNFIIARTTHYTGAAELKDTELYGRLQSEREVMIKQGVFSTAQQLERDPDAATKRGLPFYRKALDVLANTLAAVLNEANVAEGPLFSNDGNTDNTENINASNIAVSQSWANGSFRVDTSSSKATQSTANDNLNKILNLLNGSIHEFRPQGGSGELNDDADSQRVFFTGSFQELFTNHMVGSLASDIKVAHTMLGNYETVSNELYVDRDAVHGVDLNDEAMNMMMYQKSYAAACRLMTTYDSMIDRLINGTAV